MERFSTLVSRAAVEGMTLSGFAVVYNQPTLKQRDYAGSETIARGAFDGLLESDVVALVDHDMSKLLGRTKSGTLALRDEPEGLAFDLQLPDTTLGRDVAELVRRGDLAGMSFSAAVDVVDRTKGGVVHRKFSRLVDISLVASPAYDGTSVLARSSAEQSLRGQLAFARHMARRKV